MANKFLGNRLSIKNETGGSGEITPEQLLEIQEGSKYISVDMNEAGTKVAVEFDMTDKDDFLEDIGANAKYVELKKVLGQVYCTNTTTGQEMVNMSAGPLENSIVKRDANGKFQVGTPTEDFQPTHKKYVDEADALKEDKTNKVTTIGSTSTDTEYPSAKCVYDALQSSGSEIITISGGTITTEQINKLKANRNSLIYIAYDETYWRYVSQYDDSLTSHIIMLYQAINQYGSPFIIKIDTATNTYTKTTIGFQNTNERVTTISSSSTNNEYPTAKAVYDYIGSKSIYVHYITFTYTSLNANARICCTILNNDATQFTLTTLRNYLSTNGFTDKQHMLQCGGAKGISTVGIWAGLFIDGSYTNDIGIMTENGTTIYHHGINDGDAYDIVKKLL